MVVAVGEAQIRAAFAQRIACYDTPSTADWVGAAVPADSLQEQLTGPDEIAVARFLEAATVNGEPSAVFNVVRIPVATMVERFGALFAAGKPTTAQILAACAALHPPEVTDRCGICRYAEKFKSEGILA